MWPALRSQHETMARHQRCPCNSFQGKDVILPDPVYLLPPPLGGGDVPARPPDEPPQEGKAPTTPSCSPPVYLFSSMDVADGVLMALPNDAPGSKPAHHSLPSCVSTDKMWLDDETHGTRRSYLFSLARAPTAVSPSPVSLPAA